MMTPLDFQLRFKARAPQLMWLLGAGASASAGIKTAWHMIWEFKRIIYGLEKKVADSRIPALLDDSTRALIQSVLDQTKKLFELNSGHARRGRTAQTKSL